MKPHKPPEQVKKDFLALQKELIELTPTPKEDLIDVEKIKDIIWGDHKCVMALFLAQTLVATNYPKLKVIKPN